MTASFKLSLDTFTGLSAQINGGNPKAESSAVNLELTFDPDAVEVKIWGDINPLDPGNAGMGETEAGAEWMAVQASFLVALTTNPALKHLHVRVRDDVWNEATADAAIQVGEGSPLPVPPPQRPRPAKGVPEPPRRGERRQLVSTVRVGRVRDRASLECRSNANLIQVRAPRAGAGIMVAHHIAPVQVPTHVDTSVKARFPRMQSAFVPHPRAASSIDRRDGERFIATLHELGIL